MCREANKRTPFPGECSGKRYPVNALSCEKAAKNTSAYKYNRNERSRDVRLTYSDIGFLFKMSFNGHTSSVHTERKTEKIVIQVIHCSLKMDHHRDRRTTSC